MAPPSPIKAGGLPAVVATTALDASWGDDLVKEVGLSPAQILVAGGPPVKNSADVPPCRKTGGRAGLSLLDMPDPPLRAKREWSRSSVIIRSGADIGQHTSPLKLFEYLASGRPIVASDLPVFHNILKDRENALLAPPAGHPRLLRRRFGNSARNQLWPMSSVKSPEKTFSKTTHGTIGWTVFSALFARKTSLCLIFQNPPLVLKVTTLWPRTNRTEFP